MPYALTGELRDARYKECLRVYELHEDEPTWSHKKLAEELGIAHARVSRWLRESHRWFPWIDDICIERALEGDKSAYEALTNWEVPIFWEKLNAKRMSMAHAQWQHWVHIYAGRMGMVGGDIGDRLHKRFGPGFKGRPKPERPPMHSRGRAYPRRKDRFGTTHRHLIG
jgi:transcriptional regulator with XRE-family HTH domain